MLEHCSYQPAPNSEEAVNCVTRALLDAELADQGGSKYTEEQIKSACREALEKMGGEKALGSQSGWLTFFRVDLIKQTTAVLCQRNTSCTVDSAAV
eukprot:4291832-Pyramimonas_sp.AAC.1